MQAIDPTGTAMKMKFALLLAASLAASPAFGGSAGGAIHRAPAGGPGPARARDPRGDRALATPAELATWDIEFVDLAADYAYNANDQIVLSYRIGRDRAFESSVYEKDCETPLGSNFSCDDPFAGCGYMLTACDDPFGACGYAKNPLDDTHDLLELKYQINKTRLGGSNIWNGTHIELCQGLGLFVPENTTAGTRKFVVAEDVREVDVLVDLSVDYSTEAELGPQGPFIVMTIPNNVLNVARFTVPPEPYSFATMARVLRGALLELMRRALGPGRAARRAPVRNITGDADMTDVDYEMVVIESCADRAACEELADTTTIYQDLTTYMKAAYDSGEFAEILRRWVIKVLTDEGLIRRGLAAADIHDDDEDQKGVSHEENEDDKGLLYHDNEDGGVLVNDEDEDNEASILEDDRLTDHRELEIYMLNFMEITGTFGPSFGDPIVRIEMGVDYAASTADVASYVSACKCGGMDNFTCDSGALVPNEELLVCVRSVSAEVEVDTLQSMLLTQGDASVPVIEANEVRTPSVTVREYVPGQNGVVVSTRVPTNIFNFSDGQAINITGVIDMQLSGGSAGRRLQAPYAGRRLQAPAARTEAAPYGLDVRLGGAEGLLFEELVFGSGSSVSRVGFALFLGGVGLAFSFAAAW